MIAPRHETIPTILFGAFDRHNFGDLLFPHIAERLLGGAELLFAGLAERDLRDVGGHPVRAITRLAEEFGQAPVNILHVGGELLSCDSWQAAVMLQSPEEARQIITRLDEQSSERAAWARQILNLDVQAPYTVPRLLFRGAHKVVYNAVGGVELAERNNAFRNEVFTNLKSADFVSVREYQTQKLLGSLGIDTGCVPDPAVMTAELFGTEITSAMQAGEVAMICSTFPQGYLAVQFSADFGDDATLALLAVQLDELISTTGYGVVLFRAGTAPWHDDLECYQRLIVRMHSTNVAIFNSLDLWDICAVIARSRGYCGSSLHGRIVAMAYALPRLNLCHPLQEHHVTKQGANAAAWEIPGAPSVVAVSGVSEGMLQALAMEQEVLQKKAEELANDYRKGFHPIRELLTHRGAL